MEPATPVLIYPAGATPRAWGRLHGETFRREIHALTKIRVDLSMSVGVFETEQEVFDVAQRHLAVLEAYDRDLFEELMGIAEGAECTPEMIVVVNHYTDLRDIDPGNGGSREADTDDGCTAVYARAQSTTLLGMTWDTHGSATDFTVLLGVPARVVDGVEVPAMWLLTIMGCLGMTGFNARGHGVVINNLKSVDARVGVVWPAIIRKQLRGASAREGQRVLAQTTLASGHHYLMADAQGEGVGVETSGERAEVVFDSARDGAAFLHTNHCLCAAIEEVSRVAPTSTTYERFSTMQESMAAESLRDLDDLWTRYRLVSYDRDRGAHTKVGTCAAIAMALDDRVAYAVRGPVGRGTPRASLGFEAGAPVVLGVIADPA